MNLARFVARDPYRPQATQEELDALLLKMDGVVDWTIHSEGEVTLEYDPKRISDEIIEDAFAGLGFELTHIFDIPHASQAEVDKALDHGSSTDDGRE
jgi:hypothetical protein